MLSCGMWIAALRTVGACAKCASLNPADLYMKPDVAWIADEEVAERGLEPRVEDDLQHIFRNRVTNMFYVSLAPGVGEPGFRSR